MTIAPDEPTVEYEFAVALFADEKTGEACELFKKDVLARPVHMNGRYALALAFEADDFAVPAMFEFLDFLALDPASPKGAEAARHLQALLHYGVERKDAKNITINMDPNAPSFLRVDAEGASRGNIRQRCNHAAASRWG